MADFQSFFFKILHIHQSLDISHLFDRNHLLYAGAYLARVLWGTLGPAIFGKFSTVGKNYEHSAPTVHIKTLTTPLQYI